MIPENIEIAKQKLKERNLPKEVEKLRLEEIEEHINNFKHNEDLRNQFDYIFYNDYTEKSIQKIIELLKNICINHNNEIKI